MHLHCQISRRVFDVMRNNRSNDGFSTFGADVSLLDMPEIRTYKGSSFEVIDQKKSIEENVDKISSRQFELYKRHSTVVVSRPVFLNVVCDALSAYKYVGPNQMADLLLACR